MNIIDKRSLNSLGLAHMINLSLSPTIPKDPGIYAMYDRNGTVAYVGLSKDLRDRIGQHIIRRDSSVTTGVSATILNPDKISHICWWLHESFSDKGSREAAEIVAFEVLNPSLRSRGKVTDRAKVILEDQTFCEEMKLLFHSEPSGVFHPNTLDNLANLVLELYERVLELQNRVSELEKQ